MNVKIAVKVWIAQRNWRTMNVKTTNNSPGKDDDEMTPSSMELELTSLTLQLLTLTQELVNAKLRMEDTAKVRGLLNYPCPL